MWQNKEKGNNILMIKKKYKITFYKLIGKNWYMICTRTKKECRKMALQHVLKRHAIGFKIQEHVTP